MSRLDGIATGCGIVLLVLAAYTAITVKNMSERPPPEPPKPARIIVNELVTHVPNGRDLKTVVYEDDDWDAKLREHKQKEIDCGLPR